MGTVEECGRRLREWLMAGWGFVTLGVALTITAFLLGIVYFSIRAITTSLEHVDIVPTYATALLLCCVGILTMFLYKRRDTIIAVPTMVLNFICLLLALASFVLLLTKVIRVMRNFRSCSYEKLTMQCHCYTTYDGHGLSETVYNDAMSCSLIEGNLLKLAYTQSALFLLAALLGVLTTVLTAYITYNERKVDYLLEEDEEPFEQDFETLSADNLTDPLIGQYRQIMSRQITLPDFSLRCGRHLSRDFQPGAGSWCDRAGNPLPAGNLPPGEVTAGDGSTSGVLDIGMGWPTQHGHGGHISGVTEQLPPYSESRPTTNPNPVILWDGFFRPPEVGSRAGEDCRPTGGPTGSGAGARGVCRSESDGGQWSLRPLLLPMDPLSSTGMSRPQRGRRRSRERPRSRSRRRQERHQPYIAFLPVPYSMYRPSALLGLGISPFPMEPPPPYSAQGVDPPSYVSDSPAPPYTSRPASRNTSRPVTPVRRQQNSNIYENTASQTERNDIIFQTRI